MNKLEQKEVWVEVNTNEKLPDKQGEYYIKSEDVEDGDQQPDLMYFSTETGFSSRNKQFRCLTWLEKQSGYFFTEQELKAYDKEQNLEWKEECERLDKVAQNWQELYYKVCPPYCASLPKIDNL